MDMRPCLCKNRHDCAPPKTAGDECWLVLAQDAGAAFFDVVDIAIRESKVFVSKRCMLMIFGLDSRARVLARFFPNLRMPVDQAFAAAR